MDHHPLLHHSNVGDDTRPAAVRSSGKTFFPGLLSLALLSVAVLTSGCVTNGRQFLLKEYGPSIPASQSLSLEGKTVCLQGFTGVPDLVGLELKGEPSEPKPFKYMDLTREQDQRWVAETKAALKTTRKENWREIGNLRNGFGMVMSHVYSLNDPAVWLTESLKLDLEAQGAKVVDASRSADADVSVSGTILLCRADMYMVVNGSLVVDLNLKAKGGEAKIIQIHTHGATAAMLASDGEYFHALRDARQKFSILAIQEIARAAK